MLYSDNLGQAVTQVALSHDGNCMLASCLEVGLRLLDMGSGELLARYAGAACCWQRATPSFVGCSTGATPAVSV